MLEGKYVETIAWRHGIVAAVAAERPVATGRMLEAMDFLAELPMRGV